MRIVSAVEAGTTATFTTATAHFFAVGQEVIVQNVTVSGYNGAWEVLAVPTTTTFTATMATSGLANDHKSAPRRARGAASPPAVRAAA